HSTEINLKTAVSEWRKDHQHIVPAPPARDPRLDVVGPPPARWWDQLPFVPSGTATSPTGCPYCTRPACTGHSVTMREAGTYVSLTTPLPDNPAAGTFMAAVAPDGV